MVPKKLKKDNCLDKCEDVIRHDERISILEKEMSTVEKKIDTILFKIMLANTISVSLVLAIFKFLI